MKTIEFLLEAKLLDPKSDLRLSHISFYFDNSSNQEQYEQNKNKLNYSMGHPGLIVSHKNFMNSTFKQNLIV
ncbi:hypothetical protein BH23THE1_BH23THE1_13990 [soil metagenome]